MNRGDSFETRLKWQPQRQLPAAWRREILAAARVPEPATASWLRAVFWPHPVAWGALAAVWMVVFGMAYASRDASPAVSSPYVTLPTPQLREMLLEQERLLAELAGPAERPDPPRPAALPPQPRSQRREDTVII